MSSRDTAPMAVLADVLRGSALVGIVVSLLWLTSGSAVQFVVVFAVLLVPRIVGVPAPFDAAYCAALLVAAWAKSLHWYAEIPWMDIPVHFVAGGATAAMLYLVLARVDFLSDLQDAPIRTRRSSILILTVALGLAAGTVWEMYEWAADRLMPTNVIVGYDDTIGDLTMDGLGSLLAGLALIVWAKRGFGVAQRSSRRPMGHDTDTPTGG